MDKRFINWCRVSQPSTVVTICYILYMIVWYYVPSLYYLVWYLLTNGELEPYATAKPLSDGSLRAMFLIIYGNVIIEHNCACFFFWGGEMFGMNSTHVNIVYGHIGMGYYWAYSGQTSSIKNGNTNIIYIYICI